jgi:hypothetical protein
MPQDHWPPGPDVIEVSIPVDIEQVLATRSFDEERVSADCPKGPRRGVHATGDQLCRSLERGAAFGQIWQSWFHIFFATKVCFVTNP